MTQCIWPGARIAVQDMMRSGRPRAECEETVFSMMISLAAGTGRLGSEPKRGNQRPRFWPIAYSCADDYARRTGHPRRDCEDIMIGMLMPRLMKMRWACA